MKIFDQINVSERRIKKALTTRGIKYCVTHRLGLIEAEKKEPYADAYEVLMLNCRFQYDCFAREEVVFPSKLKTATKILWNRIIIWFQFGCD